MNPLNVARALVPMAFVSSVHRSIRFYERLGFKVRGTFTAPGTAEFGWASLESGTAQLMLARATEPVIASQQSVMFYVYCDDVPSMKKSFDERGITTSEIQYPFYAPGGEFRVGDPDGYVVMITHT